MSSTAQTAQGTKISMDTGTAGTPVFTVFIANVTDISGFDGTASEIDVTDLASIAKEKVLGLQDWGKLTLTTNINLSEATHAALLAVKKSGAKKGFQVTLSDGSTITFQAFVASFPIAAKVDGVYTGAISLTITGDITLVVGGA
jgi:predicted secreted protein